MYLKTNATASAVFEKTNGLTHWRFFQALNQTRKK